MGSHRDGVSYNYKSRKSVSEPFVPHCVLQISHSDVHIELPVLYCVVVMAFPANNTVFILN